jgi:fatty-acyl-CoA synthase
MICPDLYNNFGIGGNKMDFKKLTLDCVIETLGERYTHKTAVVFEDESVTYGELYAQAETFARNLRKLGVKKNDKVAVILPNCMEYLYIYFGLFMNGSWIVPVSTRYEPDEIKRVIGNSDANTVIYQDRIGIFDYNKIFLEDLKDEFPLIKNHIVRGDNQPKDTLHLSSLFSPDFQPAGMPEEARREEIYPDDIAILGYTSGTTGHPKGVMITHKNLIVTSYYAGELFEMKDDIGFSVAPLYAAQGFNAVLAYFVSGITMKWISNFSPNDILKHVVRKNISLFHTQPTMWMLLLSMPYYRHVYFSELQKVIVSGSVCTPFLAKKIEESTKCTLINAYGLIEATGAVCMTRLSDPEDVRHNTIGRPIPGVEIKIVDRNRKEVKKGEIGELAVRGYLMAGYYKNEEKTKEIIDEEGWLYTGDLACYYNDGINICIAGRCKDMVIRGGFNVYPVDIEECLLNFDKVDDVSVVGKPHDILGESLVAFIIPKANMTLTSGEVMAYCRGKIANYKVPDEVIFVSQFPVLESGKIQKNILARWAVEGIPPECRFLLDGKPISGMAAD